MESSALNETEEQQQVRASSMEQQRDDESRQLESPALDTVTPQPESTAVSSGAETAKRRDSSASRHSQNRESSVYSSWSTASDRQLGHGHGQGGPGSQADPTDRVFPIRSVVSVDPGSRSDTGYFPRVSLDKSGMASIRPTQPRVDTATLARAGTGSINSDSLLSPPLRSPHITESDRARRSEHATGSKSSVQADVDRQGSRPFSIFSTESSGDEDGGGSPGEKGSVHRSETPSVTDGALEGLTTTRFKHVATDDGHLIITGRDGTLHRCEDEPIHTPGAVQGFGLLLAIREEPDGQFTVRYASENSRRIIGYTPLQLFRLSNFTDILSEEQADNLLDHIDFIRDEDADPSVNGPEVFSMSIRPPKKRTAKLWCAIHIHPAHPELIICEFELDDDHDFPLRPDDERTPDQPEDTLRGNPTMEELAESTEITSKPLRVLRSARKRRGEAGAMQVFDIMSQVQEQLAAAPNLETFLKILVGIVKELTGFHRVMIYQFDSTFNGKVVTELVDPSTTRDLYKGLHFPASDIPKQARDLYKLNKVRLLYDRDQETARLVCRSQEDLEVPLDLTHSYLRAMSPIHLKYLGNMSVRSSMSISINAFNELWGLIACHSYGNKGMRVSFPIRKMCRLVGDTVSRNIERLSYASRLQARKLINTVPTDKNPSGYIIASSDDLLKLFDADFGMLSIKGETKIMGKVDHTQEALAMLEYLKMRRLTSVMTTQDVTTDFPDLRYPPGFHYIAGLLYVPLSVGGHDFIVFFRRGQVREVKWAGNPYEKIVQEGTRDYLEPRKSFQVWHETVVGKCREWSEEHVETAAVLCLVYGKFIEVWRQKEAALQNSRLTKLLLANSAHEVRTPLNAIINYLEIALEGSLDQETRDNLARSHSASKSLIYVINDLLDLTKTEEGNNLVKDECFDFVACFREATEPFQKESARKGIDYEVTEHSGLPNLVYGDQRRVRQAITNVTANAVEHTKQGHVKVECYCTSVEGQKVRVEIVVEDTGDGMSEAKLDALFQDLEQVSTYADESDDSIEQTPESVQTLGLGLAVVARIIRNMDGQLRLKSADGKGSRFVMQLPLTTPPLDTPDNADSIGNGSAAPSTAASVSQSVPNCDGEVMLIDRGGAVSKQKPSLTATRSFDDSKSVGSQRSNASRASGKSNRSDADRLIDAIQTPFGVGEAETDEQAAQRSRGTGAYYGSSSATKTQSDTSRTISPDRSSRPGELPRSLSSPGGGKGKGKGKELQVDQGPVTGLHYVTDSKTPIKPVKIPDDYQEQPEHPAQQSMTSGVVFELGDEPGPTATATTVDANVHKASEPHSARLQVLVAEDDPINAKILRKRLEKAGHTVHHTVNGEDCAQAYRGSAGKYDVVLMDMQMPIVDGRRSTEMIREIERAGEHGSLSAVASNHGRIPIFAVSASLIEREKDSYMASGFDGWILKPVDFKRLEHLLFGIIDDKVRNDSVYKPGQWERGGWFQKRLGLPSSAQAKDAPALRDAELRANEIIAARAKAKQ